VPLLAADLIPEKDRSAVRNKPLGDQPSSDQAFFIAATIYCHASKYVNSNVNSIHLMAICCHHAMDSPEKDGVHS
jgi:hypothetical protein